MFKVIYLLFLGNFTQIHKFDICKILEKHWEGARKTGKVMKCSRNICNIPKVSKVIGNRG